MLKQNKDKQSYERRTKSQFQYIIISNTSLSSNLKSISIDVAVRSHYLNNKSLEMARSVVNLSTSIFIQETQVQQHVEIALLLLKTEFKQK